MASSRKKTSPVHGGANRADDKLAGDTVDEGPGVSPQRKNLPLLVATSVLLVAWLTFMATMAYLSK
jgi:hypothetical protein